MSKKISINEYTNILKYYNIPIPSSKKKIKSEAEKIMADKLCKCIKKVGIENEPKAIGICTRTIFNQKGYTRGKFQCKNKKSVKFYKFSKKNITKKLNTPQ